MKIKTVHTNHLRNDEHFQFITAVINLVTKFGAAALKIAEQFAVLQSCYDNEDKALKKIVKSAVTAEIEAADQVRDRTFRGLTDACKSALNHYEPAIVEAAKRLDIVMHTYGNIAQKTLNAETSAVYNLCQELLSDKYDLDLQTAGLKGWVQKLDAENQAFDALVMLRNAETAAITQLKMKECRTETDKAYDTTAKRVNAAIIMDGEAAFAPFVNEMNTLIDEYNSTIARREK